MLILDENGNMVVAETTQQPQQASTPAQPATGATPVSPILPPTRPPENSDSDPGFLDYAGDAAKGAYNGVISFGQETGQFAWDVGNAIGLTDEEKMPGYDSLESIKAETTTMAGKLTEDVVALGLGFIGAGKILAPLKLFQKAGKATAIARGMTQGAMADFVVMDPVEQRLSDFVQQYPTFANPVTEALAAKEGDSRWEGRLKNAAEGVLVGTAFETFFWSIKAARGLKHKNVEAVQEAAAKLEAATAHSGPHAEASSSDVALHKEFADATKADRGIDGQKALREAAASTKTGEELLERSADLINPRHLSAMDDEALKLHEAVGKAVYDKTLHAQGPEKLDELVGKTVEEWRKSGMDTRKVEEVLGRVSASSAEGKALRQDVFALRSAYNTSLLKFREAGEKLASLGAADETASLQALAEVSYWAQESGRLAVAVKDAGTEAGRALRAFGKDAEMFKAIRQAPDVEKALKQAISEGKLPAPKGWQKKLQSVEWRQAANDPRYAAQVAQALTSKSGAEMLKEAYISSILFGVRTNLTNTISNAGQVALTPAFRAIANIPEKGFIEAARQEWVVYQSMARNISTALQFAGQAWKERRGIIDSAAGASYTEGLSRQSAWTRENILGLADRKKMEKGIAPAEALREVGQGTEFMAGLVDAVGKFIQLPGRFLEVQDEFFKQLAYRSEVEAAATEEALKKFGRAKPQEVAEFVQKRVSEAFDKNGAVSVLARVQK